MLKPYQSIPIQDCGESLIPLPLEQFSVVTPHPYEALGAPYGERSPYSLRQSVVDRLHQAQSQLQKTHSQWRIQIFDAYRPIAVQQFMVDYSFSEEIQARGLLLSELTDAQKQAIWTHVHQFWAIPSPDSKTPPPHSTGAAIDITLVDERSHPIDMGSPIDELSPRSYPDYFTTPEAKTTIAEADAQQFHQSRQLLRSVMHQAGFRQHPYEWWHFSYGDQFWVWLQTEHPVKDCLTEPPSPAIAHYGSI